MKWPMLPLHRVASLESGFGFPRERQGDAGQEFPFFRVSDMNLEGNEIFMCNHTNTVSAQTLSELGARAFPAGTVIFPKIGAAIATEKKRILTRPATFDNNVMGAIPTEAVDPKFLYYWFLRLRLLDLANPGHVPSIRKSVMEQIPFELPTLSEQRRIVEILDEADRLCSLRREADAKVARVLPALFLKMFGDPATNPKGLRETLLGDVVVDTQYGTSVKADAGPDGIPVLRMNNITASGALDLSDLKYAHLEKREVTRQQLEPGDLLFNRTNSKELVGKTGVWEGKLERAVPASYLIRVRVDVSQVVPRFVWAWMNMPYFKRLLANKCRHAIGMANINATELRRFPLVVPSLEAQESFDRLCTAIAKVCSDMTAIERNIEHIFRVLLSRAFSGELTREWREAHIEELLAEMEQQAKLLSLPLPSIDRLAARV